MVEQTIKATASVMNEWRWRWFFYTLLWCFRGERWSCWVLKRKSIFRRELLDGHCFIGHPGVCEVTFHSKRCRSTTTKKKNWEFLQLWHLFSRTLKANQLFWKLVNQWFWGSRQKKRLSELAEISSFSMHFFQDHFFSL